VEVFAEGWMKNARTRSIVQHY